MRRRLRKAIATLAVWVLKQVALVFFDRRFLRGRHFESSYAGWSWVLRSLLWQELLGFNRHIPWPVSPFVRISSAQNIEFHPDDLNNFQGFGCYFQNFSAKIVIGRGTYIAPNVGIITANHDTLDPEIHQQGRDVIIGEKCWIGMNSVILPGVVLGDHTVVGAGSVVTKSFPEGYAVIAGVPARVIRRMRS